MIKAILVYCFSICLASTVAAQTADEWIITIRLLDPRIVTNTSNTMNLQLTDDENTDIIASRTLTKSEKRKLLEMLDRELTDDEDVPFCGHSPAYAVLYHDKSGKLRSAQTLCGLCKTWAGKGNLRAIKGKEALTYLEKLLPLPDYFSDPATAKKKVTDSTKKNIPFYDLDLEND